MVENIRKALANFGSDLVIILLALLVYRTLGYYTEFLRSETQDALVYLAGFYIVFGLPYFLFLVPKDHNSKGVAVGRLARRTVRLRLFAPTTQEKVSVLFLFVKFFFLPLMINFVFDNYFSVTNNMQNLSWGGNFMVFFNDHLYIFLLTSFFLVDTVFFAFGYALESRHLRNSVVSVESTFLGWAVALISYPPFNSFAGQVFQWGASDFADFGSLEMNFAVRLLVVALTFVFLAATISLGTKCSNLTNRGIVSRGPYRYVRHPAYLMKLASWWLLSIPLMSIPVFVGMGFWTVIYFLRAWTEERHLSKDENYLKYKEKVRHMFIPKVF